MQTPCASAKKRAFPCFNPYHGPPISRRAVFLLQVLCHCEGRNPRGAMGAPPADSAGFFSSLFFLIYFLFISFIFFSSFFFSSLLGFQTDSGIPKENMASSKAFPLPGIHKKVSSERFFSRTRIILFIFIFSCLAVPLRFLSKITGFLNSSLDFLLPAVYACCREISSVTEQMDACGFPVIPPTWRCSRNEGGRKVFSNEIEV